MKKICLTMFALLFAGSLAYASLSRINGMGLANWMLDDDANIWMSPAYINDYPNRVWGQFGNGGNGAAGEELVGSQYGGASLNLLWGLAGNVGLFAGRPYPGNIATIGANAPGSDVTVIPANQGIVVGYAGTSPGLSLQALVPTNNVDAFYGLGLGSLLKLGVRGSIAFANSNYSSSRERTPKQNNDGTLTGVRTSYDINIGAGVTIGQLGPIPQMDVYGNVGLPLVTSTFSERALIAASDKYKTADMSLTNPGAFTLLAGARLKLTLWSLKFIVNGNYGYNNLVSLYTDKRDTGTLNVNLTQDRANVSHIVNTGIALNQQIDAKTLLVLGAGVGYTVTNDNGLETDPINLAVKDEYKWSQTILSIPLNIGIEHQLPLWGLIGRAGARFTYTMTTTGVDNPTYDAAGTVVDQRISSTPVDAIASVITLGLGKQITDTLSADLVMRQCTAAQLSEGLLGSLTTQMSLVYKF